ncbi:MAG TPA: hypothetical protein VJX67_06205 [Blastocatellia bacterium]|nr:hypothetical protein [Blastocatellia bacterium]
MSKAQHAGGGALARVEVSKAQHARRALARFGVSKAQHAEGGALARFGVSKAQHARRVRSQGVLGTLPAIDKNIVGPRLVIEPCEQVRIATSTT